MLKKELTQKEKQFAEEYIKDLNGKQAAIRSGYAEENATAHASRLLGRANVRSYVNELKSLRAQRTLITADMVLLGLKEVADRCMQARPVLEWDYLDKQFVQKIDEETGKGVYEFDSSGANRALELLGKHVGFFEKDNSQKSAVINVNIMEDGDNG